MKTVQELIESLPLDRKDHIKMLLERRRTCSKPERSLKARTLNAAVRNLNLKYCPTMGQLLHTDQFYVTYYDGRKQLTVSLPAAIKYGQGYRSPHSDSNEFFVNEHSVSRTGPNGVGGVGDAAAISDNLRDELNGDYVNEEKDYPIVKKDDKIKESKEVIKRHDSALFAKPKPKQKVKQGLILQFKDFIIKFFKKKMVIKNNDDLSAAYIWLVDAIRNKQADTPKFKAVKLAVQRVDSTGHYAFRSGYNGWGRAHKFMTAITRDLPDNTYTYQDFSDMIFKSFGIWIDINSETKIDTKYLKKIAGRIRHSNESLPKYDK